MTDFWTGDRDVILVNTGLSFVLLLIAIACVPWARANAMLILIFVALVVLIIVVVAKDANLVEAYGLMLRDMLKIQGWPAPV